jgi:phosphate/sulfate permease
MSHKKRPKDKQNPKKSIKRAINKKILVSLIVLPVLAVLISVFVYSYLESKPSVVWYVEEEYKNLWERILRSQEAPQNFIEVRSYTEGDKIDGPGIIISRRMEKTGKKIPVYYRLSYDLEYEGALVLAVDPWMIFRNHLNPRLSLERIRNGGEGELLLAGRDGEAVSSWTARLLQKAPGEFSETESDWVDAEASMYLNGRFTRGANTYNWSDVFFRLLGNDVCWVYAPLSRIRNSGNPRTSILEATEFPEPDSYSQKSLQARLLWAIPVGTEREQKKYRKTIVWLKSPQTQTAIADETGFVPAHPRGEPYDPVSQAAWIAWLTSSWIYEVNASP